MARQTKNVAMLAGVLGLLLLALCTFPSTTVGHVATIAMLNIGQGDSFLIQAANGKQLLIDGGRDAMVLSELAKAMPRGDRSIDVVLATHPDADHIGGLPLVLERYHVGLFLTSQVLTDTATFAGLYKVLQEKHIPSYYVRRGMTLTLDPHSPIPAMFSILFPDRDTTNWETNSASVVGRLQLGERSALFTGDSPSPIEHYLATIDPKGIDVDILKLGHHGSKYSSSTEFLKATSPVLALISAGVGNRYGHPNQETLDRLKSLSIPWVSTQDHGQVTLTTDGNTWTEKDEK